MSIRPSPYSIDLDSLAVRESEQIEWKENVADEDDVVKTLSAFANDLQNLGGGYVVCGVAERNDQHGFPQLTREGLTASRLKQVEGIVSNRCLTQVSPSIAPLVQEIECDKEGRRILVFIQPATGTAHTCRLRDGSNKYWVRAQRKTVEARNGVLRNLLSLRGVQEPWDRRPCLGATVDDLDLLALRDALQRMRVFSSATGIEPYLSEERPISALVPSLLVREPLKGLLRPRNFAILLFGREPQRFIPGAVSIYSIYPGQDRSDIHSERLEFAGTIIEQAAKLGGLLDVQSSTAFDKSDAASPNTLKYPKRALYEALGNAIAHRDYEMTDPTRITIFNNRVEIGSPGSLPHGVDPVAFAAGTSGARWRNQALAWIFNRLQLAQAEGQGIPTILRTMREEGCPPPLLEPEEAKVTCTLPAHPRHALLRVFRDVERDIALGRLPEARNEVLRVLRNDPTNTKAVELYAEIQIALRDPKPIADFIEVHRHYLTGLPPSALLLLSDALGAGPSRRDGTSYSALSADLLRRAQDGQLEERSTRRVGIALIRNFDEQGALDLIDRQFRDHPDWRDNAALLQVRGDALIGLAKQCRKTLNNKHLAQTMRARVLAQMGSYLGDAESDLTRALALSDDPGLTAIIRRNLSYASGFPKNRPQPRR